MLLGKGLIEFCNQSKLKWSKVDLATVKYSRVTFLKHTQWYVTVVLKSDEIDLNKRQHG